MVQGKERAAEAEMWSAAFKRLVGWAIKHHGLKLADAEETVQEGIRQFLSTGGVADPADLKGLLQAVGSRINGVVVDRRRKKALREDGLTDDHSIAELIVSGPEQQRVSDDVARKAVNALLDRIERDELLVAIVMQMSEGVEDAAEQAKALGRDVREVYNARRRLKPHVEAVARLMEAW